MTSPTLTEFLSYLDGELPFTRRRAFEMYLHENLEAARRLRQIERLEDRLVENLMVSLLMVGQSRGSPDGDDDGDHALATPAAPAPLSVVRDGDDGRRDGGGGAENGDDREEAVARELAGMPMPAPPTRFPPLHAVQGAAERDGSEDGGSEDGGSDDGGSDALLPEADAEAVASQLYRDARIAHARPSALTTLRQTFARMSGWVYRALIPTPHQSGHIAALSDTSLGLDTDRDLGGVGQSKGDAQDAAKGTINAIIGARVDTNINVTIEKPPPSVPSHRHASPIATARNPAAAAARELVGHRRTWPDLPAAKVRDLAASVCELPVDVQAAWIDGCLTPDETRQIIRALSASGVHSTDLVRLVTTVANATRVEYPPLPAHIQVPTSEPTIRRHTTSSYLVIDESLLDEDDV